MEDNFCCRVCTPKIIAWDIKIRARFVMVGVTNVPIQLPRLSARHISAIQY